MVTALNNALSHYHHVKHLFDKRGIKVLISNIYYEILRNKDGGCFFMARIRCLHLADLHLGWAPRDLGGREDERRRERDGLLKKAVDLALAHDSGIQMVVIAGDLFETHRPDGGLVDAVLQELRRLERAGIFLITVPGNHDEVTYIDSVYRRHRGEWPGILVTNPMPEKINTINLGETACHLYSLAYTGGLTRATDLLSQFPHSGEAGVHVGVFHGSLDWQAGERSLPLSSQGLAQAGYDYVALGHIHRHQEKTVNKTLMLYPGAVEGKTFSDPGEGFFTVAQIGEGFPEIKKIPAKARVYQQAQVDVTGMSGEADLEKEVERMADPEAMVELRLQGVFSFLPNISSFRSRMSKKFYHLELKDETEFFNMEILRGWATEPTLRGSFLQRMLNRLEATADEEEQRIVYLALVKGVFALTKEDR